jgi:transposase
MGDAVPQTPWDLSLSFSRMDVFPFTANGACRTIEKLDRRVGQRRDATRAPIQARNGWRPHGRRLGQPATPSKDARNFVQTMGSTSEHLAQQFRQVFQERDSDALKSWMKRSAASDIPELKRFAAGIERDYEAVSAAVEQHWSNGQVEGQVHRLKLLKRQMYGRSGFLLLRRRVLPFTTAETQRSP